MANKLIRSSICFCAIIQVACDRPECKNTNPIFDKFSYETKEYKDELISQMARIDNSKLTYWLDKYEERDSLQYLHISLQGKGLCAKGVVTIKSWDNKLERVLKSKGKGYSGAELKHLRLKVNRDSATTELIYQGVDAIID